MEVMKDGMRNAVVCLLKSATTCNYYTFLFHMSANCVLCSSYMAENYNLVKEWVIVSMMNIFNLEK